MIIAYDQIETDLFGSNCHSEVWIAGLAVLKLAGVGVGAVRLVTVFPDKLKLCNESTCLDKCDRNSDNFFYCQQALGFYSGQNTTCPIYSQFNSIHN